MPVTPNAPGPYAPAETVLNIIDRFRTKGLPTPIDADVLARAGVSASLIPRTLQALRLLDLIDESGAPTETFNSIRLAPEADYKPTLAKWLEATYADVLQFVEPSTATDTNLADAFRKYEPQGQQPRMITLFKGLFRAAGLGPEKVQPTPRKTRTATPSRPEAGRKLRQAMSALAKEASSGRGTPRGNQGGAAGDLPPALAGLLASVPLDGSGWTRPDRQRFLTAFEAVLDFTVPLIEPPAPGDPAPEPEDFDAPL